MKQTVTTQNLDPFDLRAMFYTLRRRYVSFALQSHLLGKLTNVRMGSASHLIRLSDCTWIAGLSCD
jgi:hypothetical protein